MGRDERCDTMLDFFFLFDFFLSCFLAFLLSFVRSFVRSLFVSVMFHSPREVDKPTSNHVMCSLRCDDLFLLQRGYKLQLTTRRKMPFPIARVNRLERDGSACSNLDWYFFLLLYCLFLVVCRLLPCFSCDCPLFSFVKSLVFLPLVPFPAFKKMHVEEIT